MAEVHIIDIDGEQWDIKDLPLTQRVITLEEDNVEIKNNISDLQNDKKNIKAESFNGNLNDLSSNNIPAGIEKNYYINTNCENVPNFPGSSVTITNCYLRILRSFRYLMQEIEYVYYSSSVGWVYLKYRRFQIDGVWLSWKIVETENIQQ